MEKIVVSERKRIHELELAQRTVLDGLRGCESDGTMHVAKK